MFVSNSKRWNKEAFIKEFDNECYWDPLKLEDGKKGIFLETTFKIEDGDTKFWLKNANEFSNEVWRYHHYESQAAYATKRATLLATLKKVDKMASGPEEMKQSALAKMMEFIRLGYPRGIMKYMCYMIAYETGNSQWMQITKFIGLRQN